MDTREIAVSTPYIKFKYLYTHTDRLDPVLEPKSFTSALEGSFDDGGGGSRLGEVRRCARSPDAAEVIHLKGRGHTLGRRRSRERERIGQGCYSRAGVVAARDRLCVYARVRVWAWLSP